MADYVSSFSGEQIDNAVDKVLNGGLPVLDETGKIPASQLPDAEYVVSTMLASGWAEGKYSFEAEYPNEQYNISIEVAPTATAEQFEAFGSAMICGSATENAATALSGAPSVDIPIIIKVVRK